MHRVSGRRDSNATDPIAPLIVLDLPTNYKNHAKEDMRDHVGASADLEAIASEFGEQVRLLDGLVHYRFGDNAELMGAWASARNVVGPFRSKAEPEGGAGETPGVVKQVA